MYYQNQYDPYNAQQRMSHIEQKYQQMFQPTAYSQISGASQAQVQNVTWIPVAGIQGAREHIVQPGMTAWLMDNNEPVFYVKASDNLGVTSLKMYRFTEITEADTAQAVTQYVQRDEFERLKEQIEELTIDRKKVPETAKKEVK